MDDINEEPEPTEPADSADETLDIEVDPADDTVEFTDDVADETTNDDEPRFDDPPPATPPPPYMTAQAGRLTRDPYATLGGVLSGIAHRYGWDVALTRLGFIVLIVLSGGTAIPLYLLAWLIIPRALHWPPVQTTARGASSRLSGRDLGIGLIGLGALVVLGIGSGQAAAVLVPLALVGGGVWLLVQSPRDAVAQGAGQSPTHVSYGPQPAAVGAPYAQPLDPQPFDAQFQPMQPSMAPQPVPKRSRLRRFGIIGLFGFLALMLLLIVAIPIILIAVISNGDFDIDNTTYAFTPTTVEQIPGVITEDAGEIILDLRAVDFSGRADDADPIRIDIDLDVGRIEVLIPNDVRVAVDAESDLGDVNVFGSSSDGIKPAQAVLDEDPQLDIELDLNVGEIVVRRGTATTVTSTITEVG